MDFKKLKNKLVGKSLNEGTGYVRLKNRLSEAQFPWHKFPEKPKDAGLPIGKKGEKDVKKPGSIFRGMGGQDSTNHPKQKDSVSDQEIRKWFPGAMEKLEKAGEDHVDQNDFSIVDGELFLDTTGNEQWIWDPTYSDDPKEDGVWIDSDTGEIKIE